MRILNAFEQKIIDKILDCQSYCSLPNLLDEFLEKTRIEVDNVKNKVNILYETQNHLPTDSEIKEIKVKVLQIQRLLISITNLILMLEREGYIIIYNPINVSPPNHIFGKGADNMPFTTQKISDKNIIQFIINYTICEIIPTEELTNFKNMNYLTREEVRFRKNMLVAWIAISISFLGTLFSLCFNIYESYFKVDNCQQNIVIIKKIEKQMEIQNQLLEKYKSKIQLNDSFNLKKNIKNNKKGIYE